MSALLERRVVAGKTYEVRRVRGATRLTVDGVLHTQHDPSRPVSGRVWDLLALPGIVTGARRALVLGVAGGAAIRQLVTFGAVTRVDAVDLDATSLALGRAHFGLDDPRVRVHHEDARVFVARSRASYDVILDDVFGERDGAPFRAIAYDAAWARMICARLTPRGVLVVNAAGPAEVRGTTLADPGFLRGFASRLVLTTETAGNVVHVLARRPIEPRGLRRDARRLLGAHAARLRFAARTLRVG